MSGTSRSTPEIDFLLDAFNDCKESISFLTVTFKEDGTFNVYFHGSEAEIALAMKASGELDDIVYEFNKMSIENFK